MYTWGYFVLKGASNFGAGNFAIAPCMNLPMRYNNATIYVGYLGGFEPSLGI